MMQWWATNIAWRLRPTSATRHHRVKYRGKCKRCHKPREDKLFMHCRRCRAQACMIQARRRAALVERGACPRCGGARDDDGVACSSCRAKERIWHKQRKADGRR